MTLMVLYGLRVLRGLRSLRGLRDLRLACPSWLEHQRNKKLSSLIFLIIIYSPWVMDCI